MSTCRRQVARPAGAPVEEAGTSGKQAGEQQGGRLQALISRCFPKLPFVVLLSSGSVLAAYVIRGSPSAHSLLNAESMVGLSFLAAAFSRSRVSVPGKRDRLVQGRWASGDALALLAVCVVAAAAYARILGAPFVFDGYGHIGDASRSDWHTVLRLFGPVEHKPGLFFRPLGFLLYRLNYSWAGIHAVRWYVGSIALHAIDSCLVYLLCREVGLTRSGCACAGLLFAVNGCGAEPVAWVDAGFDLIATGCVLLALTFVCRYLDSGGRRYLLAAMAMTSAAVLSKESAFCLPGLVVCVAFLRPKRAGAPRDRFALLCVAALCTALFIYRWWALGGIGGYGVRGAGAAGFLRNNLIPSINALLFRQWAILFFPVNWSVPASATLRVLLAALPFLLAILAAAGRPTRRQVLACLGFTLAAALPAQKMLLIGVDLSGTRTLYLPIVGMAIAWGLLLGALDWRFRTAAVCALLTVQTLTLEHDLTPWRDVPELARSACVAFGGQLKPDTAQVMVRGLPATKSGVVFLANGFPECVQMNTGISADRVRVQTPSDVRQASTFEWDETRGFVRDGP